MGITEVVRGDDLLPALSGKRILFTLLTYDVRITRMCHWWLAWIVAGSPNAMETRGLASTARAGHQTGADHWLGGAAANLISREERLMPIDLVPQFNWAALPCQPVVTDGEMALTG